VVKSRDFRRPDRAGLAVIWAAGISYHAVVQFAPERNSFAAFDLEANPLLKA
jgi:hypothetical protein